MNYFSSQADTKLAKQLFYCANTLKILVKLSLINDTKHTILIFSTLK